VQNVQLWFSVFLFQLYCVPDCMNACVLYATSIGVLNHVLFTISIPSLLLNGN